MNQQFNNIGSFNIFLQCPIHVYLEDLQRRVEAGIEYKLKRLKNIKILFSSLLFFTANILGRGFSRVNGRALREVGENYAFAILLFCTPQREKRPDNNIICSPLHKTFILWLFWMVKIISLLLSCLVYFQMNRAIQVKPADSENRGGKCGHFYAFKQRFLSYLKNKHFCVFFFKFVYFLDHENFTT